MDQRTCSIDGCADEVKIISRGWCGKHYWRWQKYGDPLFFPHEARRLENLARRAIEIKEAQPLICEDCGKTYEPPQRPARPKGPWCEECKRPRRTRTQLEQNIKYMYGISLEEHDAMMLKQQGRCAICNAGQSPGGRPLQLDHSHATGKVRAFLCSNCNTGIGVFLENPELLQRAIAYLEEHSTP